ncbi:MAG: ABC transporter substrate-binding protein [Azospirillaceae bacterium]|nr:ABC transporter substrate-binding protein [Azospirillaceae bacterium]
MFGLKMLSGRRLHAAAPELCDRLIRGEIGRRDFLQTMSWLGVSAASASVFASAVVGDALFPTAARAQEAPKRGGSLRFVCQIQEMTDPAAVSWIEASVVFRNTLEYLTLVDADNVSHPYLAESWTPSDDLKTWDFKLRSGVKWSNGDDFTAEDVAYTIKRWLAPESKSSNKTSFAAVTQVEIIGPLAIRLHLDRAILAIPEMLYAYNCPILHRKFDDMGADWPKNPIGTGPYELAEFAIGQKATFRRRAGYWGTEPYLDEIRFIDMGTSSAAHLAALSAGQVDILYRIGVSDLDLVKRLPNVQLLTGKAAQTIVMRMQVDQKPFDDIRVRKAVLLAADNQQMLELGYRGEGTVAADYHVAQVQPEYFPLPPVKRDIAQAKALLKEAGHPNGVDVTLMVGNTQGTWEQNTAQVLQQNCAEAGIRINLNVVPSTEYWPVWNKVPFGLTYWAHRPLAVQTLDLAYRSGAAWNETHLADKAFDAALDKAMAIVDVKQRSQAMEAVERILQDQAIMVQPFWSNKFTAISSKVRDYQQHPSDYFNLFKTWLA